MFITKENSTNIHLQNLRPDLGKYPLLIEHGGLLTAWILSQSSGVISIIRLLRIIPALATMTCELLARRALEAVERRRYSQVTETLNGRGDNAFYILLETDIADNNNGLSPYSDIRFESSIRFENLPLDSIADFRLFS